MNKENKTIDVCLWFDSDCDMQLKKFKKCKGYNNNCFAYVSKSQHLEEFKKYNLNKEDKK